MQPLKTICRNTVVFLIAGATFIPAGKLLSEQVAVRHSEGEVHGFLVLRSQTGQALASGDLIQAAHGDQVTSEVVFHFKDDSVHDETVVFSQHGKFRLLKYHLVQKGHSFPHPIDLSIDGPTGQVTIHTDPGEKKVITDRLNLPEDLANGMIPMLLKNYPPETSQMTLSMLVTTPKPRVVKLSITHQGEAHFSVAGSSRKAMHYVAKIEIGGIAGFVAPLIGKQPPNIDIWIYGGEAPVFVKSEGPLFYGGPIWRIELLGPTWP